MEQPTRPTDLAAVAGISIAYASEILANKRQPSRPLAIHILRKTGWRHAILADLTAEQIDTLEQIEPWTPKPPAESPDSTPADQAAAA